MCFLAFIWPFQNLRLITYFKQHEVWLGKWGVHQSCKNEDDYVGARKNKNERDQNLNGSSRLNKEQEAGVP